MSEGAAYHNASDTHVSHNIQYIYIYIYWIFNDANGFFKGPRNTRCRSRRLPPILYKTSDKTFYIMIDSYKYHCEKTYFNFFAMQF